MIGDSDLNIRREQNSTPWLTDAIWSTAKRLKRPEFVDDPWPIEDDHLEFLEAGIESVDLIDLDYPAWHKATDDLDHVSAKSLQAVGDVAGRGAAADRDAADASAVRIPGSRIPDPCIPASEIPDPGSRIRTDPRSAIRIPIRDLRSGISGSGIRDSRILGAKPVYTAARCCP